MKFFLYYENQLFINYLKDLIKNNNDECVELSDYTNNNLIYRRHKPDWILIDLQLKDNSGFKVAEILKSDFPKAKIALLSNFDDERLKVQCNRIGAVFIPKEKIFDFYNMINFPQKIDVESNFVEK